MVFTSIINTSQVNGLLCISSQTGPIEWASNFFTEFMNDLFFMNDLLLSLYIVSESFFSS